MHFIGLIIAVATAIWWISRAAQGAKDLSDMAQGITKAPRRNRFRKKAAKRGIDLIDNPREAATILMVSVARLSKFAQQNTGTISDASIQKIIGILQSYMKISGREADELLTQMRWSAQELIQPETALLPMTTILRDSVNHAEAEDLSDMLRKVSHADGDATPAQKAFIDKFRERTGLAV